MEEAYWFDEGVLPRPAGQGLPRYPPGRQRTPSAQVPFASRRAGHTRPPKKTCTSRISPSRTVIASTLRYRPPDVSSYS